MGEGVSSHTSDVMSSSHTVSYCRLGKSPVVEEASSPLADLMGLDIPDSDLGSSNSWGFLFENQPVEPSLSPSTLASRQKLLDDTNALGARLFSS